ncbi:mitochondrial genome maintenance exonuclease 1-like [Phymastichus coffea]|uniref:mitochondrial genome maintenance exonuclease 1-like n=1 Tax=Phymastichus coffea TaxID=108790 RepID=UPI00273B5240|nr:mitochondrial genome maintenance exonuclease 1-like [Phymastichus coffea]
MFWRNPRDAALLGRAIESSKCFAQPRYQESKYTKAKLIKQLRLDNKLQFGQLIETKVQKTKRLQLESKGLQPLTISSNVNSELAWVLAQSPKLTRISSKSGSTNSQENHVNSKTESTNQSIGIEVDINLNCDIPKVISSKNIVKNVDNSKSTNKQVSNEKNEANAKDKSLVSNDLLKDILQYPIIENYKNCTIEEVDPSQILTISSRKDKSSLNYPSVTKILTATMSEEAKAVLEAWKLRMIQKLGARGFEIYQAELLGEGKILHSTIMDRLMQKEFSIPDRIKHAFSSVTNVIDIVNKVQALESYVVHSKLQYRGIVDCVAVYRDELCVIDWKKSDKTKSTISSTYDAPLQLAAYIGAINSDPNYPFQLKKGLVVVAYMSGKPAEVHEIEESSLQLYWELWLKRLQNYHSMNFS